MPRDSGQKAIKSNELFHWQARFLRITLFWSACDMGLPLSLSRCKSAAYCFGTCVSVQQWLCFFSQLATSLINLIHRWQQAIFSHLVDDHVMWNRVGSLPEVKIYYVCPFPPYARPADLSEEASELVQMICWSQSQVAYYPSFWALHVVANWLGILILWLMHFLSLFRV